MGLHQIVDYRLFSIVSKTTVTEQEGVLTDLRNSKDGSFRYSSACFCHVHIIATGNAIKDFTFVGDRLFASFTRLLRCLGDVAFLGLSSESILLKNLLRTDAPRYKTSGDDQRRLIEFFYSLGLILQGIKSQIFPRTKMFPGTSTPRYIKPQERLVSRKSDSPELVR